MADKADQLAPKQARSERTKQRILAATLELLSDRHFEAITIAEIASKADMAVGNFYKRFKNKEALLPHLYAEYNKRFQSFADHQRSPADAQPGWQQVISLTVSFFEENKGLIRALHLHSRLNPDVVPPGSDNQRAGLYHALLDLVSKQGLDAEAREKKARVASLIMVSSILEAVLYPDRTPAIATQVDRETLIDELTDALQEYTR